MADLKKVRPGDRLRIPAATFNAFIDATKDHQSHKHSQARSSSSIAPNSGIVLIRNDSNDEVPQFGVLGISEPLIGPADNEPEFTSRPMLAGALPTTNHRGRFAVCLDPIAIDGIGRAVVSGVTIARLALGAEPPDPAEPLPNTADAISGRLDCLGLTHGGAAQVLWRAGDYGEQWAVIRLGPPPTPLADSTPEPIDDREEGEAGESLQAARSDHAHHFPVGDGPLYIDPATSAWSILCGPGVGLIATVDGTALAIDLSDSAGPGLEWNGDTRQMAVAVSGPVAIVDGRVTLPYGDGLELDNFLLKLKTTDAFTFVNGALAPNGATENVVIGGVTLHFNAGLFTGSF